MRRMKADAVLEVTCRGRLRRAMTQSCGLSRKFAPSGDVLAAGEGIARHPVVPMWACVMSGQREAQRSSYRRRACEPQDGIETAPLAQALAAACAQLSAAPTFPLQFLPRLRKVAD